MHERKLGYAYMLKGDADFGDLQQVFGGFANANLDGGEPEIIEISSDKSNYQSDCGTTSENSWWNEIAWYGSDSVESLITTPPSEETSVGTNDIRAREPSPGSSHPSRSSTASNSPFKKSSKH